MPQKKPLKKTLFYFEPLNVWDKIAIWVYGIATFVFICFDRWGAQSNKVEFLITYALVPQLANYWINYRSLANFKSYLIWFGYSVIHVILYFFLLNDPYYKDARQILLNTIVLMSLYQLLRLISIKLQRQELAMPTKDYKDMFSNRAVTFLDFILFVIYSGSFMGLTIFAFSR